MFKMNDFVKNAFQLIGWLLLICGIAWLLYTVKAMIVYLIIAGILTFLGKPIVRILNRIQIKGNPMPIWLRSMITIIVMFGTFAGAISLLAPAVVHEIGVLGKIDYQHLFHRFENEFTYLQEFAGDWEILEDVLNTDGSSTQGEEGPRTLTNIISIDTVQSTFGSLVSGMGNIAIAIFSVTFILFFFLKEEKLADTIIDNFINDKYTEKIRHIVPKVKKTLTRYIVGLVIQLSSIFLMVYLGLTLIGFENAVIIALFAATMNVIPYIGPIVGIAFGLVLGLGQELAAEPDLNFLLLSGQILGVFTIVQLIDNVVSQPLIFSNSINAHPLEIFIVISIAGTLSGIAGMVVAVPLYSILRIVAKEFEVNVKFIQTLSKNA